MQPSIFSSLKNLQVACSFLMVFSLTITLFFNFFIMNMKEIIEFDIQLFFYDYEYFISDDENFSHSVLIE